MNIYLFIFEGYRHFILAKSGEEAYKKFVIAYPDGKDVQFRLINDRYSDTILE